ncbi:kinase-like protein [Mycena leptocephala]|nr:kinase-like protein [Mycena leptocephala]
MDTRGRNSRLADFSVGRTMASTRSIGRVWTRGYYLDTGSVSSSWDWMLKTEHTTPAKQSLADLSRNASVISNSSTDSEQELTPPRPRPIRTFSAPRSRSPQSPATTRGASRPPPSYLSRELGYEESSPSPAVSNGKPASKPSGKPSLQDFQFGRTLGEGSYSTVNVPVKLGTSRTDGKQYAIKVITKSHLIRAQKVETASAERDALIRLRGHPGIVSLYHTFQDDWSLYFVIDLAVNGEMQSLISRLGSLSTRCVQYYAAQIADAMEYMHSKDVIHRDLKPENLLLDDAFRIKITDFGTGKVLKNGAQRATSFVGTAQYQSPELLELKETTKSSDYWAFGCVVYQMIAGRFAFNDRSDYLTWQKVKKVEYEFPVVSMIRPRTWCKSCWSSRKPQRSECSEITRVFFIHVWTSLWTDPAPPIEAGLVKKEHPLAQGQDRNGRTDGIDWSSDAEALQRNGHTSYSPNPPHTTDIGPKDEIRASAFPSMQDKVRARSLSNDPSRDASSSSSHESSSGNAADRLRESMERLDIRSGRTSPDGPARDSIRSRGRDRAPTPLRNNEPDPDLQVLRYLPYAIAKSRSSSTALKLMEGEKVLFDSPVEARTPRRRASRLLLPMAGPALKSKRRHLVLTNRRLFCLKSDMSIKLELVLRSSEKAKIRGKIPGCY